MIGKDLSSLPWQPSSDPDVAYTAKDLKGKGFSMRRNAPHSEMMFVINDGLTKTPGWYTDKDGAIRRVS